jgi:hypothetical protein
VSRANQLVQTVFDFPEFQRVSKSHFLKNYDKVFLYIENETGKPLSTSELRANILGKELTVIDSISGIDLVKTPCYEFHIYSYSDKEAEIAVKMTRYGAYAEGKLYFHEGKWVPNKKFRISQL